MSLTLASLRSQLSFRLSDHHNLVYDADTLDEALRASLAELSRVNGADLFISGLDESLETTLPESFVHPLLVGAVAFALRFRAAGHFEPVSLGSELPSALLVAAQGQMERFQNALKRIRLGGLQASTDCPYDQWDWDEGTDFE